MEKERNTKIMVIISLLIGVVGLSLGFAAFSNTIVIKPQASVNPDSGAFKVYFSKTAAPNFSSQPVEPTIASGSAATATNATINNEGGANPTISNLNATFTQPGQSVSYTFYAYNRGQYVAYLRSLYFENVNGGSTTRVCTAGTDTNGNATNASIVAEACNDITITIEIEGETARTNPASVTMYNGYRNHSLAINASEQITVKLSYVNNGHYVDGPFSITFGNIKLTYSTIDGSGDGNPGVIDYASSNTYADSEQSVLNHISNIETAMLDLDETAITNWYEEKYPGFTVSSISKNSLQSSGYDCNSVLAESGSNTEFCVWGNFGMGAGQLPAIGVVLPISDTVRCYSYTLSNGTVTKADECRNTIAGWNNIYQYTEANGVEILGTVNTYCSRSDNNAIVRELQELLASKYGDTTITFNTSGSGGSYSLSQPVGENGVGTYYIYANGNNINNSFEFTCKKTASEMFNDIDSKILASDVTIKAINTCSKNLYDSINNKEFLSQFGTYEGSDEYFGPYTSNKLSINTSYAIYQSDIDNDGNIVKSLSYNTGTGSATNLGNIIFSCDKTTSSITTEIQGLITALGISD